MANKTGLKLGSRIPPGGHIGGFTTFSVSLETLLLINNGRIAVATTYVMASVGLCLLVFGWDQDRVAAC